MTALISEVFGRINEEGTVDILYVEDGHPVTRLDASNVYPVNSSLSVSYDHAEGIKLTQEDARLIGIDIE
ncbi:hypothetical protein A8C14_003406 [Klebsiella aerogenes]|uniref:hypothetical protein n=1 Tax=Klebsiella aerogenes TaxID=548 RepID=UPI002D7EE6C3|nr:hypothetical protein [Klebsiella aerogenes]EIV2085497.1 hypothetical protein [Klebsiella aerogenes]EIW9213738.1 hypothetical protein [Klebsiella aerogenes]